MSAPSLKVTVPYEDNLFAALEWLHEQNIKCKSLEYSFPLGSRPGELIVEFFQAEEALLFKLTWH